MKLQRYSNNLDFPYLYEKNGYWCKSNDVEKLEQLNAEMLEALYKIHGLESITDIERICESIIGRYENEKESHQDQDNLFE